MPDIILERVSVSTVSISTPIELEETYVRLRSLPEVPEMIVVPKRWSWQRNRVKAQRSGMPKLLLQENMYIYTVFAFSACAWQGKSVSKKTLHIGD